MVFNLRPVKRAFARQFFPSHARRTNRFAHGVFGLVPSLIRADAVIRTQSEFDRDFGKAKIGIDLACQRVECRHFGLNLLRRTENMAIVLGKATHAHDAVQ